MAGEVKRSAAGRRVIVTGATGLIGRHVVAALIDRSADVVAVARNPAESAPPNLAGAELLTADLLDASGRRAVAAVQADTLLHLAWDVSPGYVSAPSNLDWLSASLELIRDFQASGGSRAVLAGTCMEYDWRGAASDLPLNEKQSVFAPTTLYGHCKFALRSVLEEWAATQSPFSLSSGLVFFPFGPDEMPSRLVPSVVRTCLAGGAPQLTSGHQVRDFVDVWTAGEALAELSLSDVQGPVNIASGVGMSVRQLAMAIRDSINPGLEIEFGALQDRPDEPSSLIADTGRLVDDLGFHPSLPFSEALERTIAFWRSKNLSAVENAKHL
ncbi:MAG: NAD(P)-dependent oxidoreductase [Rhodospirillaceae bacterium]|jgi:nucleoside-diphosphate-sugar epimerase|nr:NAD(P)-dependent oxidoreductase [Rhodospirillaceae bacterium]